MSPAGSNIHTHPRRDPEGRDENVAVSHLGSGHYDFRVTPSR